MRVWGEGVGWHEDVDAGGFVETDSSLCLAGLAIRTCFASQVIPMLPANDGSNFPPRV